MAIQVIFQLPTDINGQLGADVVARARARMDQALGLQQVVRLEHGGRADATRATGLAH